MNKSLGKAIFAIIIGILIVLMGFILFYSNLTPKVYGATYGAPDEEPIPQPQEIIQETDHGIVPTSGGGSMKKGTSGSGGSTPVEPEPEPEPQLVQIGAFDGHWGEIMKADAPFSTLSGTRYALEMPSGEYKDPYIILTGSIQGETVYIRFPTEQSLFQGMISHDETFTEPDSITGRFWQETANPQTFITFFTWNNQGYWIFGHCGEVQEFKQSGRQFLGHWGATTTPSPLSILRGAVDLKGVPETTNVAKYWLTFKGDLCERPINILIPYEETSYHGYLFFLNTNSVDIVSSITTGNYWSESPDSGAFISFFSWRGSNYWIFGQGQKI